MKLGIMQPYFVPYIGYWQLINAVDAYVIYDDVNFIKNGWIHRNRILLNGQPHYLNLPIRDASPNKLISQVRVSNNDMLQTKLMRTLEQAYKKAPEYRNVIPLIEGIIRISETNLARYIAFHIRTICDYLDIRTRLILSSNIGKNNSLRAQDKVIHICELLNANEYYNAIGGMELYSAKQFSSHRIRLGFVKTHDVDYRQYENTFVPSLSIIDTLMFNSKDQVCELLNEYTIIDPLYSE